VSAPEPTAYQPPNRAARRSATLLFRFELTVGDTKVRVSTTPGDVRRARHLLAAEGLPSIDAILAAEAGSESMEFLSLMAWLAIRHEDDWATVELEAFLDQLTEILVLRDEGDDRLRPTPAGPPNA